MSWEEKLLKEYNKQKYREEVNSGHYKASGGVEILSSL